MIRIIRTNPGNSDFQCLVSLLDAELKVSDGKEHSFFAQFNKIDSINYAVVAYSDNFPTGCGAFKKYSDDIAEIKRMFVREEFRGNGIAKLILNELESWANELNFTKCILETGKRFTPAVNLYKKAGYAVIPNYGQYQGVELSLCMRKSLELNVKVKN